MVKQQLEKYLKKIHFDRNLFFFFFKNIRFVNSSLFELFSGENPDGVCVAK